jgi:hypothetical protein
MALYLYPPTPVSVSIPPVKYSLDGVNTTVTEDTSNAANNRPLPSAQFFIKNGVRVPVKEDSNPANSNPLPVKLVGLTGDVNITAGDLNISTSALNDSMAIGDPVTNNKAKVALNSDATTYALKVKDDDANALLTTIDGDTSLLSDSTNLAGSAHVNRGIQVLGSDGTNNVRLKTNAAGELQIGVLSSPLPTNAATLTEQQTQTGHLNAIKTSVELIDDAVNTDGLSAGSAGLAIGGVDGNGDFQQLKVNTSGELVVNASASGIATETTLSAINNKVSNDYGAATGAIRTASQIGNATGAADFDAGADSAQTLRVSANLKRAGNELSYDSGASDSNTLRTVLATRHEAAATPVSARLSNGTNFISTSSVAGNSQTTDNASGTALKSASVTLGFDSVNSVHKEILVDGTGKVVISSNALGDASDLPETNQFNTAGLVALTKGLLEVLKEVNQNVGFNNVPVSAKLTVGTNAVRATYDGNPPATTRKKLYIKGTIGNTGKIFVGGASVTTSNGMEIVGPDRVEFDGPGDFYVISDTAGQSVEILEV